MRILRKIVSLKNLFSGEDVEDEETIRLKSKLKRLRNDIKYSDLRHAGYKK